MCEIFKFVGVVILTSVAAGVIAYSQNKNLEKTYQPTDWIIIPIESE